MTLIVDAGPLVALGDRRDPMQAVVERLLRDEPGSLVVPAPITAEVDFLLGKGGGAAPRERFYGDLAEGRLIAACLEPQDDRVIAALAQRYADLDPGLADLSVVVLAHRFGTTRVATFDEHHFRVMRPLQGGSFTLLPADA